ncbi:PD-(D/E)XK nuclease family protein [Bradyrhizobium sp. Ghvi]|uniref:PD-(D/E)XK nuclease family protein n=1 Tax=Bradyrhizobium sp. Ghvi TaxID=1855319 RepID=UPI000B84EE2B|nr:PD-(D/E)XK nuclease family protein [Bradyrhizobium sp. Ghvi]
MSLLAVTSVSSRRRLERALVWLEARERDEELLVVGATVDAANELARQVASRRGAVFGWHRISLSQLVSIVAAQELASRGVVPLTKIGADAISTRLIHRLRGERKLGRYACVSNTPGFPRAIAGVVAELRSAGVRSAELDVVAPDLALIVREYERELAEGGFIDWSGTLELATSAIARLDRHRLVGLPALLFDVAVRTEAEFGFLSTFVSAAQETLVTVPGGDAETLHQFRDRLGFKTHDLDLTAGEPNDALARLQRHLFNENDKPPEIEGGDEIEIFSAPGEGRECVEIARRILLLARDGLPFDRMAVLLRSADLYRSHLAEAFSRSAIPVHFARGAVRPEPAGRAFCCLLDCASEGLSAQRFAEYLSLGQVPDAVAGEPPEAPLRGDLWVAPDAETAPASILAGTSHSTTVPAQSSAVSEPSDGPVRDGHLRAPRRWERLLVEAAVIGGSNRWRRRLDGFANDLRRRLEATEGLEEARAAAISRELDDLTAFSCFALPLIDELENLPISATWREWLDRLSALAARSLRRPQRVLAVLAELEPMASVGPVTLDEILAVLRSLLLEAAEPPSSQRYGKLFVGTIESARGLSFEAVFVPGLAEKMFPKKIVEEPILLDVVRAQLGSGLATNRSRLDQERLALVLAVGAAERRMFFSYPRVDLDQSRPRVPSFYALEAVRSAEGRLPDFAELTRRAETVAASRLGWPAPDDPNEAIDDAEHDLAVLGGLMGMTDGGAGRARYLLGANPYLARALRNRYQRWNRGWTVADGLLSSSADVRSLMAKHALNARGYSPTALQTFSRCPYSFFLHAIQRIAPRDIAFAIDDLNPLQRGSLIHDVQFALFARLTAERLLPVRPGNLERAGALLEEVMVEVTDRYEDELAPAIDQVWQNAVTEIRADLREWLRRMSEDTSGFVPKHFELSFGLASGADRGEADPRSVSDAVLLDCGIRLRGSIDLVERHPSGLLRVVDHKTGRNAVVGEVVIDGGKSLQPVLYALAAEKIFKDDKVSEGRLYFCTSTGQFSEQIVALDQHARDAALDVATIIGRAIERPFLPAAPAEGQCGHCDYRAVCGPYEEIRSGRKPQSDLDTLKTLRAWE